jgi:hypothetical protein
MIKPTKQKEKKSSFRIHSTRQALVIYMVPQNNSFLPFQKKKNDSFLRKITLHSFPTKLCKLSDAQQPGRLQNNPKLPKHETIKLQRQVG